MSQLDCGASQKGCMVTMKRPKRFLDNAMDRYTPDRHMLCVDTIYLLMGEEHQSWIPHLGDDMCPKFLENRLIWCTSGYRKLVSKIKTKRQFFNGQDCHLCCCVLGTPFYMKPQEGLTQINVLSTSYLTVMQHSRKKMSRLDSENFLSHPALAETR